MPPASSDPIIKRAAADAADGDTAQSLRQRADERLYDAKRDGRGRVAPARSREAA